MHCSPFSRTGNGKIKQDFIYKATNVQRLRASETAEIDANVCFFIISVLLSVYIQAQVLQWWAPVLERQCCWKTREEGRAERQECWDMVERRTTAICCVWETKARSGATDVDSSWYRWEWNEAVVMLKKEYVSSVENQLARLTSCYCFSNVKHDFCFFSCWFSEFWLEHDRASPFSQMFSAETSFVCATRCQVSF